MKDYVVIPLQPFHTTKVSLCDYEWVSCYNWTAKKSAHNWYAVRYKRVNGKLKRIWLHREIMKALPTQNVHHINADSLDNRQPNLLCCTQRENLSYRKWGTDNK